MESIDLLFILTGIPPAIGLGWRICKQNIIIQKRHKLMTTQLQRDI